MEGVPLKPIQKYLLVNNALQSHSRIESLITRGQKLDLTSLAIVRIFFAEDLSSFIIYRSDAKNVFNGLLFDGNTNRVAPIDEKMFKGTGSYGEIQIFHLILGLE